MPLLAAEGLVQVKSRHAGGEKPGLDLLIFPVGRGRAFRARAGAEPLAVAFLSLSLARPVATHWAERLLAGSESKRLQSQSVRRLTEGRARRPQDQTDDRD